MDKADDDFDAATFCRERGLRAWKFQILRNVCIGVNNQ
jgi:hypothetical protein